MSGSTQGRWAYAAAWLLVLTIYLAAFLAGGFPPGYAFRGALAKERLAGGFRHEPEQVH